MPDSNVQQQPLTAPSTSGKKKRSILLWIVIAAIVVIALLFFVLPFLFELGTFNAPTPILGPTCIGFSGYSCSSISLSNRTLAVTIGQGTGMNMQNATIYALPTSSTFNMGQVSEYPRSATALLLPNAGSESVNISGGSQSYVLPKSGEYTGDLWITYYPSNGTQEYAELGVFSVTAS